MLVATIRLRISQEDRKELTQTLGSLSTTIMKQKGCRSCRVYRQLDSDDAIVLIEEWETRDDWDSHLRSTEFAVLHGAMRLVTDPAAVEFVLLNRVGGMELLNSR
ncbi:MAG: antibiotic biosynthesis monooxygenase family protein [Acidobacteriota bacterium]